MLCLLLGAFLGYALSRWEQERMWYTKFYRLAQTAWSVHCGHLPWQQVNISDHLQYSVPLVGLAVCRSSAFKALASASFGHLFPEQHSQLRSRRPLEDFLPLPTRPIVQRCMGQCYYCARGEEGGDMTCYLPDGHIPRYPGGHVCRPCMLAEPDRFSHPG